MQVRYRAALHPEELVPHSALGSILEAQHRQRYALRGRESSKVIQCEMLLRMLLAD